MERRVFLRWVSIGMIAGSLPVAIAACRRHNFDNASDNPSPSVSSDSVASDSVASDEEGFIALGSVTELNERGFLYDSQSKVIVVRNGASLSALNPICTHHQCPVEWDATLAMLSCPCHGSKFATDGTVATGPATENLASYSQTKEINNVVLVKPL